VLEFVFDEGFAAVVTEACRERAGEAAFVVDLAQQHAAAVAREVTSGEVDLDFALFKGLK
jgi:hypothetical protein